MRRTRLAAAPELDLDLTIADLMADLDPGWLATDEDDLRVEGLPPATPIGTVAGTR